MDDSTRIVLGNHDLHYIALSEGCAPLRSKDTLGNLLTASDADSISSWLRSKPLAHLESIDTQAGPAHFLMFHAGVAPSWTVQSTLDHAAEVELALQGDDYKEFLRSMYGDKPRRWHDKLEGQERLRVITNYLTRARFCDSLGNLRLDIKQGYAFAPSGYKPWFQYEKVSQEAIVLFGHWASIEGYTGRDNVHALDTGCVWGRELTLMRLEDGKYYAVS
jgi:bis(5'-nucleosyl)-tetraphosphatase (symmetrical)